MKKRDIGLIVVILAVSFFLLIIIRSGAKEGTYVRVTVDQQIYGIYDLSVNGSHEINGIGGKNLLVIADHCAWFSEADCPDQICVKSGKKSDMNETIVCLPHRVVAEIVGDEEDAAYDAVSQ